MTADATAIRPRLAGDAYFVPTQDGVCFVTSRGMEVFTGRSIYAWIERLSPYLDGRTSLGDLTASLPEEKRRQVEGIVAALMERGLARDASRDEPHTLGDRELVRYAAEIEYIESLRDSGAQRFQRYRESRVLAIGAGHALSALVHVLLRSGVRDLTVVATPERETDLDRLDQLVEIGGDPDQRLRHRPWACEGELLAAAAGSDVVVHVSDPPMLARARALDRACGAAGAVLAQAVITGDEAWVGPVAGPADRGLGWESAWSRLVDQDAARDFADRPEVPASVNLAGATAALVAGHLGLAVLRRVTGVEEPAASGTMTHVDLATLRTATHRFVPHPVALRAPAEDETTFLARVERLRRGERVGEDAFDRRVMALVDRRLGVLTEISERDFAQVPLSVAATTVADPSSRSGGERPETAVTAAGLDFKTARRSVALRALARYAFLAAGRHGLARPLRAIRLADGTAQVLDRPAVLPARSRTPPGVAAGHDWTEAVRGGLLDRCRAITVAEAIEAAHAFPRVRLDESPLDEVGAAYLELARTAGLEVAVYDITGSLRVPTFACCAGDRTVGYTTSVRAALELALVDYQARTHRQPGFAPPPAPDLRRRQRGAARGRAEPAGAGPDVADLVAALTAAGHDPMVVPLDHDPAVADVLPYTVRVVLADE